MTNLDEFGIPASDDYGGLAQLDRVAGFEPVGRGFESLTLRHLLSNPLSPTQSPRDFKEHIKNHECTFLRQAGGSHEFWISSLAQRPIAIPFGHKTIVEGTARAICKQLRIPWLSSNR